MIWRILSIVTLGLLAGGLAFAEEDDDDDDDRIACRGYDLIVSQVEGETYDPTAALPTRIVLRARAAQDNLPSACAATPVVIRANNAEGFPLSLRAFNRERLVGQAPGDNTTDQNSDRLELSPNARRRLVNGESIDIRIADIMPGQFVAPADYAATLSLQAGHGNETVFQPTTNVLAVFRFEASDAYSVRDMNLGELSEGANRSLVFFYRTNSEVTLRASSEHHGHLRQTDGAGEIAYAAHFSGQLLDLSSGSVELSVPQRRAGLQSGRLRITVPKPVELPVAGEYRDVITLTFVPH